MYELTKSGQQKAHLESLYKAHDRIEPLVYQGVQSGKRLVVISDAQIPFHDPAAIGSPNKKEAIVEHFIREYQPHYIIVAGDALDCYALSSFDKNPNRIFTTKDELVLAGNMLDGLRAAAPKAIIIWEDGNHEWRLWRTYMQLCANDQKVLEVLGALDITTLDTRNLLHLDDRGILYQPYSGHVDFLSFIVTHGDIVRSNSAFTAKAMYDKWHSSGASGHTHRLGSYWFTDGSGRSHAWHELGSLCIPGMEYVAGANWQTGFGYGEVLRNKVHFQLANVFDGSLVVPGVGIFGDRRKKVK